MKKSLIYVLVAAVGITAAFIFFNSSRMKEKLIIDFNEFKVNEIIYINRKIKYSPNYFESYSNKKYGFTDNKIIIYDIKYKPIDSIIVEDNTFDLSKFYINLNTFKNDNFYDSYFVVINLNSYDSNWVILKLNFIEKKIDTITSFNPVFKFNEKSDILLRSSLGLFKVDSLYYLSLGREMTDGNQYKFKSQNTHYHDFPNMGVFLVKNDSLTCLNRFGTFPVNRNFRISWAFPNLTFNAAKKWFIFSNYYSNKIHIYDLLGNKISEFKVSQPGYNFTNFINTDLLSSGCGIDSDKFRYLQDSTLSFGKVYYLDKYNLYMSMINYPIFINNGTSSLILFDENGEVKLEIKNIYNELPTYSFYYNTYTVSIIKSATNKNEDERIVELESIYLEPILNKLLRKPWWKFW